MILNSPILVHEWLEKSADKFPDKIAIICENRNVTYKQLNEWSGRLAYWLLRYGLSHQDRVAIFLDNSIETVIALFAVIKAGGIFVILSSQLKPAKLDSILRDCQPFFLISSGQKINSSAEVIKNHKEVLHLILTEHNENVHKQFRDYLDFETLISRSSGNHDINKKRIIDQDIASLIYTSGSTGEPKGVMSTHLSMVSVSRSVVKYIDHSFDDIILCVLPFSFGYGLYQVIMSVMCGSTVVIEKTFTYFHKFLLKISKYKVTGFPIVPTIAAMMLNQRDISIYDFSSLRFITNAGAALPVGHIKKFREIFPQIHIYSMYGLTECKRVSYLSPDQIDIRPDSVGKAIPNCRVFIVDEDGVPVRVGEIGELIVQGSNVMLGYWKNPNLTAQVFRTDPVSNRRYLYSGDYFKQDEDGYLYFVGRKDDMIKTRGERVSPKEIENTLIQCPGIAEVAVIGIPHPILGQVPKAFIVRSVDSGIGEEEVMRYAAENIERIIMPQQIEFTDSLPKTPNGKIDKQALKSGGFKHDRT